MGVDFLVCTNCEDTFPDCGHYINCNNCYRHWCSEYCAELGGWRIDEEAAHSCKYCRHEDTDNHTLFLFLLTKLGLTREEVLEEWKTMLRDK